MKKYFPLIALFSGIFILLYGCSTKKNSFVNRSFHGVTAKYNILFNGNQAFNEAKRQLDKTYEDNYWKRLPIEPLEIKDDIPMPGQSATKSPIEQGFEKAEEKAVKAIQKHSMVIDGFEQNKQIDDAYFLLGKARYYMQRFIPAREAFTFALEKYPNADLYYDMKIWKAKTDIRIQNESLAIETLKQVTEDLSLPEETLEKAHTALAMAYTQLDSTQQVIDNLKMATYYFKDPEQSSRNMFILGQIYREENKIDSSNASFEALLYLKKVPRKYRVHAQIERAKNYTEKDSTEALIFALRELAEDRDNRPYFDELYYQAGIIALQRNQTEDARTYFQKSLRFNTKKPFLKSLAYEQLGNLFFDRTEYTLAGAYYDSVLQIPTIDKNSKRIRKVIKKNSSLAEVIFYEKQLHRNDSILKLAAMPDNEKQLFFRDYIERLKQYDEQQKIIAENLALNAGQDNQNIVNSGPNPPEGKFYFYNVQTVSNGKREFKMRYGNRPWGDNWIFSGTVNAQQAKATEVVQTDENKRYDIDFYLSQIPTKPEELDSIKELRADAYYNLGLLYKEQFKEYEKAAENFENYLASDPNPKLILPVKYHLFRAYEHFDPEKSNKYREEIVMNYPDSKFAKIILNPKALSENTNKINSPEFIYENAYVCYKEGEYQYALQTLDELSRRSDLEIESKVDLLKAFIVLKSKRIEEGKKLLEEVILNYPNTEESKKAEEALKLLEKLITQKK